MGLEFVLLLSSLAASVELGPDLPARPQQKKDKTPTEIRRETPDSKERPRNKTKAGARKVPGIVADPLLADRSKPESGSLEAISVAAEGGDAVAQVNLGFLYASGEGVPQNFAEAARWYRKAADQGRADAQALLGGSYDQGKGVPQDHAEAARWYRKAADQGRADAQALLGIAYSIGEGVPQNFAEAARWYRKAADQGRADAQLFLGGSYASGKGVPQNFAEAARWYRKAADQGDADAQYKLGFLYTQGKGVPQNFAEAYFWLNLASAGWSYVNPVSEYAKARDIAAERFSPYELSAIQERCSKWMDDFERRKTLESIQVAAPPVFPTQRAIE